MRWYGWIAVQLIWITPAMAQAPQLSPTDMQAVASAIGEQKQRCEQSEIALRIEVARAESQKATLIEWLKAAQAEKK